MKTNIKLKVTPEQSEAVQKICFANGVIWRAGEDKISYTTEEYLFIEPTGIWFRGITDHNSGIETVGYTEVDADLFIRTNGTCEEFITQQELDNLSNNKSKEDMFKQYGFKVPNFDCTILAKVKNDYIGYVVENDVVIALTWTLKGDSYAGPDYYELYNLTPIKKLWYETCKFPVLAKNMLRNEELVIITGYKENYLLSTYYQIKPESIMPLSNDEIDQLKQDF